MKFILVMLVGLGVTIGCTWFWFPVVAEETDKEYYSDYLNYEHEMGYMDASVFEKIHCMAEALYFEAGNQPLVGKIAVASVIINRANSVDFPDTICDVVHQGPVRESWKKNGVYFPVKHRCQFSYYCDGRSDEPKFGPTWDDCLIVAEWMLDGDRWYLDHMEGATHYHAYYVNPKWASDLQLVAKIQDHLFYK